VIKFAKVTGKLSIKKPYTSQQSTPISKITNINKERLSTDFVFQVLYTCGKKEAVVNTAATNPSISIGSVIYSKSTKNKPT